MTIGKQIEMDWHRNGDILNIILDDRITTFESDFSSCNYWV
jgi:hypothetical protein